MKGRGRVNEGGGVEGSRGEKIRLKSLESGGGEGDGGGPIDSFTNRHRLDSFFFSPLVDFWGPPMKMK